MVSIGINEFVGYFYFFKMLFVVIINIMYFFDYVICSICYVIDR